MLLNEVGDGELKAFSAGSQPAGLVNPGAIARLRSSRHSVEGLSSKSWKQCSGADAPKLDLVITVCDNAAGESCPVWNGAPVTVRRGIPDAAADGDFDSAHRRLRARVEAMLRLPYKTLASGDLAVALEDEHRLRRGPA